jgi:hypothetical protein
VSQVIIYRLRSSVFEHGYLEQCSNKVGSYDSSSVTLDSTRRIIQKRLLRQGVCISDVFHNKKQEEVPRAISTVVLTNSMHGARLRTADYQIGRSRFIPKCHILCAICSRPKAALFFYLIKKEV